MLIYKLREVLDEQATEDHGEIIQDIPRAELLELASTFYKL